MKKLAFSLTALIFFVPFVSFAAPLTQSQAESLIGVVQSSPGTPASSFTNLITAFSNITVAQAESLIGVIQSSPGVAASSFVGFLAAFTQDTQSVSTPITSASQTQSVNYPPSTLFNGLASQLAYITCDYYNRYGNVLFTESANGLLSAYSKNQNIYAINTVLSAVENTSYAGYTIYPGSCNVQFPAGANLYGGGFSNITTSYPSSQSPVNIPNPNIDFGQVVVPANTYLATHVRIEDYCSTRPSVGDSIAVFGWPIGGSFETLTGEITSVSGYYDMTNVNVPGGMVGSTAVSTTNGCVLGQINSSGEIVDQSDLAYLFGA